MKTYVYLCFLLLFVLVFTPALAIPTDISEAGERLGYKAVEKAKSVFNDSVLGNLTADNNDESKKDSSDETVEVMRHGTGSLESLSMKEYICGSVAGEMPAVYEEEALKAQAVACYTYAKIKEKDGVTLTDDPSINQSYLSKDELREKWGDSFDTYYGKIEKAVEDVLGEYLTYDGELIKTVAYHASSAGKTESASDIWGGSTIPYLVPVDSSADKLSPYYKVTTIFTYDQIKEKLSAFGINCDFDSYSAKDAIGEITTTDGGAVQKIVVCGTDVSGADFRNALGLRSFNINISVKGENFTITTLGYGHGVGMSQYGANELAKEGWNYKKILSHYYPGTGLGEI